MVVRRPLPPSPPDSVTSSRRLKAKINLHASMPRWRPYCPSIVGSRCLSPSGIVLGVKVLDGVAMWWCSGIVAGQDGISTSTFRVLNAKKFGLVCNFYFPLGPWSNCYATSQWKLLGPYQAIPAKIKTCEVAMRASMDRSSYLYELN
jgi:hypothetical protein